MHRSCMPVKLTVSSAIVAGKLGEVCVLEALMIVVQRAHHARPGLREYQVALALALDLNSALIQQQGLDAKEGKRLQEKHRHGIIY